MPWEVRMKYAPLLVVLFLAVGFQVAAGDDAVTVAQLRDLGAIDVQFHV